jgi:hypothetical protein
MKNQRKKVIFSALIMVFIFGSGIFVVFWGGFLAPKPQAFTPHYLAYKESQSRIYAVSESTSYDYINQTYYSTNGVSIANGTGIFTINLALRNDYSSENPAPNLGTPAAPVDGTAYIRLKTTLFSNDVTVPAINVSPSDFATLRAEETGLVLASGQTSSIQLLLATNQTRITGYMISLVSVNDSISS